MKKLVLSLALLASSMWAMDDQPEQTYLYSEREPKKDFKKLPISDPATCVLCKIIQQKLEQQKSIIQEFDEGTNVIVAGKPYTTGHILIVPRKHVFDLIELSRKQRAEHIDVAAWGSEIVRQAYGVDGYNRGTNSGKEAGQTIPHLHEHILPRGQGFTWPIANATILTEPLDKTYDRLQPRFECLYDCMHDGDLDELTPEKFFQLVTERIEKSIPEDNTN